MSLIILKISSMFILLFISLIAGLVPTRRWLITPNHFSLEIAEAFAGGIFLGIALFHMLPDAQDVFATSFPEHATLYANLLCAAAFISLLFFEKVILHIAKDHYPNNSQIMAYILVIVLSVHALSEGIALGINNTLIGTTIVFLAILVHKSSESIALAASLSRAKIQMRPAALIFSLFSSVTPLGIFIGLIANQGTSTKHDLIEGAVNSFAAGTFLYIATLHNLHHHHTHSGRHYLFEFIAVIFGLAIMAVLAFWL